MATVEQGGGKDVYLFSNSNFTDVRRELQLLTPAESGGNGALVARDITAQMRGATLPPGLRFPFGTILGHHLVLAGTYLSASVQTFAIWALDLRTFVWRRLDALALDGPGQPVERGDGRPGGSWNKAVCWEDRNRLVVFGDKHSDLQQDCESRTLPKRFSRAILNWLLGRRTSSDQLQSRGHRRTRDLRHLSHTASACRLPCFSRSAVAHTRLGQSGRFRPGMRRRAKDTLLPQDPRAEMAVVPSRDRQLHPAGASHCRRRSANLCKGRGGRIPRSTTNYLVCNAIDAIHLALFRALSDLPRLSSIPLHSTDHHSASESTAGALWTAGDCKAVRPTGSRRSRRSRDA